jgi:hypothetical protein
MPAILHAVFSFVLFKMPGLKCMLFEMPAVSDVCRSKFLLFKMTAVLDACCLRCLLFEMSAG